MDAFKWLRTLGAGAVVSAAMVVSGGNEASAIPNPQENCAFNPVSILTSDGVKPIPGMAVTVNNGDISRKVVVEFSADMGVAPDAEVRLSWGVDGGAPKEDFYGPANIANNAQFWETRHALAVIPLGPGTHTIQPYWRISSAPELGATVDSRCVVAESRTS